MKLLNTPTKRAAGDEVALEVAAEARELRLDELRVPGPADAARVRARSFVLHLVVVCS